MSEPAAMSSSSKKAAVFLGDNFIELDDPAAVTLEDLCEAFGTPWESGVHVRQRSTRRVVATLPFEPLPPLSEVSDTAVKAEELDATEAMLAADVEQPKNEEEEAEEETTEKTYAVIYDLVNSNAPEMDETMAALAGPLAANIRGLPGIEETMRQLVELGAAELLTAEPTSMVAGKREYSPAEAPGHLRRIIYPASQYSPYRAERDPVTDGRHALFRNTTGVSSPTSTSAAASHLPTFVGEGGPYTSYLDSYAFTERVEVPRGPLAGARKASLVVPLTNEEQQRIFGSA
uniref:Uncharacterized protein n=1 Tax=Angomonas deanei TaxID=59799 RepID=C6K3L2_9TRYP|nr:conserved hypothetical protein [Angomonas deanei]